MLAKSNRPDSWLEALKIIGHCPICNDRYDSTRAQLFAQREAANLVHITCKKCASNFIAMIVTMNQGVSSVGIVTDLNFDDARKIYQTTPITVDEIIDGHKFFQNLLINKNFKLN
ncbi:MAG: hypothetical protein ACD_72C00205G0003 [uncultured bacterium]|nr:MAG: hypothetical protein ACD_72C00205G0003 [uncultured bacterium]